MIWIILLIVGLCAGIFGSLIGLGGGIIIVPVLLFLGKLDLIPHMTPQLAVGTSLIVIVFTGLSSTIANMKRKTTDYQSAILFFLGSGPGAIFGSYLNKGMNQDQFNIYFGIVMIAISFLLMIRHKLKPLQSTGSIQKTVTDEFGKTYTYGYRPVVAIVISFLVGTISSLFGIGGGALMMPVMLVLFSFPPHVAVATSMFLIFLSSLTGSLSHIALGNVEWLYTFALVPGAWYGAKIGSYLNAKMKANQVVTALRIVLILIGIRLIIEGL